MDKTTLGVIGALSALAFGSAHAAPVSPATSFAELLDPIPNAVARLKADNEARKADPPAEPVTEDDPACRPMSRAGCFRPTRPPAQTPPSEPKPSPAANDASASQVEKPTES